MTKLAVSRWCACCTMVVVLFTAVASLAADVKPLRGDVTHVTLYQGQALVTRSVKVPDAKAGPMEIVVGPLPAAVVPGSLFAEGAENVVIRAVRFRQRSVTEAPGEALRELQEKQRELAWELRAIKAKNSLLLHREQYLNKLENFTAPAATTEMSKGVLDAEALIEVSNYNFEQREQIAEAKFELQREEEQLDEASREIQKQMRELTGGSGRTEREAVVFIDHTGKGPLEFKLNYLVTNCGWEPAYTLRANSEKRRVSMEYTAMIRQVTGEKWENVQLRLSSANAALSSSAPTLAYFAVDLTRRSGQDPSMNQPVVARQQEIQGKAAYYNQRRSQIAQQQAQAVGRDDNLLNAFKLNRNANDWQLLEVMAGDELKQIESSVASPLSFSYQLSQPVSVDSQSDQQLVRIMKADLKGELYYLAMPVLSEFVYREASLTNTTGYDLLAGPVTTYLDGRFVGRAEMGMVSRGQAFVAGFGADPQLRTSRQRLDRTVKVQGANQIVNLDFELRVENYKDRKVTVRVMDRLPYADNSSTLKVSLNETSQKLSKDETYQRIERPKNILRWDVVVNAGATGDKASKVTFDYSMEFARDLTLKTGFDNGQEDFNNFDLMRRRQ